MTAPAEGFPSVVRLGHVDSTQAEAFQLAARGAPDRTVVVADHQRAGRGRRGRHWEAEPGTSLLVSILVRAALPPARLPALSLATAVAVGESLQRAAGVEARLKWPNDVLVGGRKIAGVLLESRLGVEALTVVGVGVNLGQRAFPAQLAGRATSVLLATGRMPERETVLAALLEAFDHWRARLARDGFAPVRARWYALSETLGRRVTVDGLTGTAVDLDEDGALVVEADGTRRRVLAGDVVGAAPEA